MGRGEDNLTRQDNQAQLIYLKRRLEDLEEVHREGKKQHAAELLALKSEIDQSRKLGKEQSLYVSKLKRQREASDLQVSELKKTTQATQHEIRELRQKLHLAQQERDKLSAKQSDAVHLRKALNVAEAKKKDDLQDRERKVMDLQILLANERQKLSSAEKKSEELRHILDERAEEITKRGRGLEEASTIKEALQTQITQLQFYLKIAFEQYAQLSSATIPKETYDSLRVETSRLRTRNARLERKLANSEDQVLELAHLIRQVQSTNELLNAELDEAKREINWRISESSVVHLRTERDLEDRSVMSDIDDFMSEERQFKADAQELYFTTLQSHTNLLKTNSDEQLVRLYALEGSLSDKEDEVDQLCSSVARMEEAMVKLEEENKSKIEQIEKLTYLNEGHVKEISELKLKLETANVSLVTSETRAKSDNLKLRGDLKKERDLCTRLQSNLQQSKMAEEALKAEIEQLSEEIAMTEGYREAYQSIADEMRGLVARNVLAEEEANRLSQFNAEILGHCNPTQKIFYVDRIRRELAETKQKLAVSTRDHETATEEVTALRGELALFKSVATPFEGKPRTNMTRVKRMPFNSVNKQPASKIVSKPQITKRKRSSDDYDDELAQYLPSPSGGDMTIDELS